MTKENKLKMIRKFLLIFFALFALANFLTAAPKEGIQSITEPELRAHVEFLASAELEGRHALERGAQVAQRYIATRFKQYGLETFDVAPDYYQTVPLVVSHTDYERSRIIVARKDQILEFLPNEDVFFFPREGSDADFAGSLLLCGYGIRAPEFEYDDFLGVDPEGKILLVFNGEPLNADNTSAFGDVKKTKYSNPIVKARIAREAGATGLLIVQPPNYDLPPIEKTLGRYMGRMNDPIVQLAEDADAFPVFYVKRETASAFLGDFDLSEYQRKTDENHQGNPHLMEDVEVTLRIRFKDVEQKFTANIIGFWPGKSDEAVVVMAHHDHEGIKNGQLYPGADDNASGVAGLLGIARAFSTMGKTPRRSIIFLSTGAEERGMLGAKYFVQHPPVDLEKIVTVINMDEIGRDGSPQFRAMMDSTIMGEKDLLMVFYSGQTPVLAEIATLQNQTAKLKLEMEPVLQFHGSSDHVVFHERGIPSVFLFTGFHSDYTSPRDTPDKIVYGKLTRVAQLAFGMVYDLATRKNKPLFDTTIKEVVRSDRKYGY